MIIGKFVWEDFCIQDFSWWIGYYPTKQIHLALCFDENQGKGIYHKEYKSVCFNEDKSSEDSRVNITLQ